MRAFFVVKLHSWCQGTMGLMGAYCKQKCRWPVKSKHKTSADHWRRWFLPRLVLLQVCFVSLRGYVARWVCQKHRSYSSGVPSLALCLLKLFLGRVCFNLPSFFGATRMVPLLLQVPHQSALLHHKKMATAIQQGYDGGGDPASSFPTSSSGSPFLHPPTLAWLERTRPWFFQTCIGAASKICENLLSHLSHALAHWQLCHATCACLLGLGLWHSILPGKNPELQLETLPVLGNLEPTTNILLEIRVAHGYPLEKWFGCFF